VWAAVEGVAALSGFLDHGDVPPDNNRAERLLRTARLLEKNALFAGNHDSAKLHATAWSLMASCKLRGIDPLRWMTTVLDWVRDGWPTSVAAAVPPTPSLCRPDAVAPVDADGDREHLEVAVQAGWSAARIGGEALPLPERERVQHHHRSHWPAAIDRCVDAYRQRRGHALGVLVLCVAAGAEPRHRCVGDRES